MTGVSPTISIRTPEGISFRLTLAGIVPRLLAWIIDAFAIGFAAGMVSKLAAIFQLIDPSVGAAMSIIAYFIVSIGYGMFFEWMWNGQTPGKRLLRLRIMDMHGLRLQLSQVVIRNLLRSVDMLPAFYFLGGAVSVFSRNCQRLGDIAANTIVIRIPKSVAVEVEDLVGKKYNSLRDYPHLEARLRQTVTPEEAALLLDSLRRARILDNEAKIKMFDDFAAHLQRIVEFPPEATEMIGSEQYVRNVVDVIYRPPVG
jgi:uncharacterized RDD family membrane protein YckC